MTNPARRPKPSPNPAPTYKNSEGGSVPRKPAANPTAPYKKSR